MNPTISSDPDRYDHNYPASNALADSGLKYWVARWKLLEPKTPRSFVYDLQCTAKVTKVRLRNSYGLNGVE